MRHRIYVPLKAQPEILRPADANAAGAGSFVLLGPMPRGEQWQFEPGDRVDCAIRKLPDGSSGLVVTNIVPVDPEEQKTKVVYAIFGAIVGAIAGAGLVLWIAFSLKALLIGAVVGAVVFSACSVRWGDSAWETLGRWWW